MGLVVAEQSKERAGGSHPDITAFLDDSACVDTLDDGSLVVLVLPVGG